MKDINKISLFLILTLVLVLITQFSPRDGYDNFSIKGTTNYCAKDCYYDFSVENVYTGTDTESDANADYSGAISPYVCVYDVFDNKCGELDVTKLADYKINTTTINGQEKSFGNYMYLGKYTIDERNQKIYFLYRISTPKAEWVYDSPLKIVAYNPGTKTVSDEGFVNVKDIKVENIYISPLGTYILLVDGYNPRYLPPTTTSGMTVYDLTNKMTKTLALVRNGGGLRFVSWIDDTHFFYKESKYANAGEIIFKIGTIK